MAAAGEAGAKVIGVDSDQRYDNETVMTSATKDLAGSVYSVLGSIYKDNTWANYAGKTTYFTAANNGVGLPTSVIGDAKANAFDRFKSFDKAAYDAVYATLANGSVVPVRTFTVADANGYATAEELTKNLALSKVAVTCRQ
jgi:basic membrane protein A